MDGHRICRWCDFCGKQDFETHLRYEYDVFGQKHTY